MKRLRYLLLGLSLGSLAVAGLASASSYGSRSNPVPKHTSVSIAGSDGWRVRVNSSTPNATAAVLAENEFNDRPAAGRQFFIINVTETYTGKGKSNAMEGLTLSALGRSNVAYDYSDDCGVVPNEIEDTKDVFSGGSLTGNVCFSVKTSDAPSLLLMTEPGFSLDDTLAFFKTH